LKDFAGFGCDFVDTTDTDDKVHFRFGRDVEIARCACSPLQADLLLLLREVLLDVGLSPLEYDLALGLCCLPCSRCCGKTLLAGLFGLLALFEEGLRNFDVRDRGDGC